MSFSPKEEFQKSVKFTQLASVINSPDLEYALRTALLTFVENQPTENLGETAASDYQQLVGARRFIRTLKNLAVLPTEYKPNRIGQLGPQ